MKAGLYFILWGIAVIIFGLVIIWPWQWGSAWSSWVAVGEGTIITITGIVFMVYENRKNANRP